MTDSKTDERGALFVTATSEDPRFNQPYIDVREWRDEPADAPVFPGAITTQHGGAAPVKDAPSPCPRRVHGHRRQVLVLLPAGRGVPRSFFQTTHQLLPGEDATPRNAQRETEAFGPLIRRVRDELDAAMLLIEHDMALVMEVSDRVYCLEAGEVIAEGRRPEQVRHDPLVVASYLGTDIRSIQRSGVTS